MKWKRIYFVCTLIGLFSFCYVIMNKHYDGLARYPYKLSEKQRKKILHNLTTDEINMLISRKIKPSQFLPYINIIGFELDNTLYYDSIFHNKKENVTLEYIVNFVNTYRQKLEYNNIKDSLNNYSFNVLIRYFDEGNSFVPNATLVPNPSHIYTLISNKNTLYTYEPLNLISQESIPFQNILYGSNSCMLHQELIKPLAELMANAKEINQQANGDMSIIAAYTSYEEQTKFYTIQKPTMNGSEFYRFFDDPGQSELQLGYSLILAPNHKIAAMQADPNLALTTIFELDEQAKQQAIWLQENAYKYGFIIRFPDDAAKFTEKDYQPFTLRYVGKELAKDIQNKESTLNQMNLKEYQ